MGSKTLAVMKFDLRRELGNNDAFDGYLEQFLNTAYMTLTTMKRIPGIRRTMRFPELETTDITQTTHDGAAYVNVPSNAMIIRGIWDRTNDKILEFITHDEYIKKTGRANTSSENKPSKWTRHGSYLYLYPTPDGDYDLTIYYRKRPATLETGVRELTEIGAEWDEPLVLLAAIQAHRRLNEYDQMNVKIPIFQEMVHNIMGIYDEEGKDDPGQIRPDESYIGGFKY